MYRAWLEALALVCLSVSVLGNTAPNTAPLVDLQKPTPCPHPASVYANSALTHSLASIATSGAAYDIRPAQADNPSLTAYPNGDNSNDALYPKAESFFTPADMAWRLDAAAHDRSGCAEQEQQYLTPPHKALWPLNTSDVATLLLTCITLFIAAGGGIGGGAVFVVLYVFVGGFTAAQAVALSNITILGGSVANFLANSSRRHPQLDLPLIDWDLILVMEPTTMLGALLGGYLNKLLPGWLTSCLLAALLCLLTYKLLKRGASTFQSESRQKRLQQLLQQQEQQDEGKHQQQQQQHRGCRRPAAAAAADGLQEPLLLAADSDEGDVAMMGSGGGVGHSAVAVKVTESNVDHAGAWFDAQIAGDHQQQQQQQQQCNGTTGAVSSHSNDVGDLTALLLQVPAHLKRLNVTPQQQQQQQHQYHAEQQQQQQQTPRSPWQQAATPNSCHALNVVTPRSQQQWRLSRTPIAAAAVQNSLSGATSSTLFGSSFDSQTVLLLPQYQQYNAQAAVAPVILSSSSSRCCLGSSCCWCFNPQLLQLSTVLNYERQQLPWQPLLTLFILSAWVVVSDTSKVVMVCGSLSYWLVVLSIVPPALLVMMSVRQWLLTKTAVKEAAAAAAVGLNGAATGSLQQQQQQQRPVFEAVSPPPAHSPPTSAPAPAPAAAAAAAAAAVKGGSLQYGGIHWTPHNSLLYPLLCSAAGVVAGLFGVGGGIVKGPLLLELGVCPEVSAATSATMIMFTAGSAAVVYINFGGVVTDYALALMLVGFSLTLLGQLFTIQLVKALGRRSVIIFMMGSLMVLASIAASYQTVVAVEGALQNPKGMWTWGSVCKHH